MGLLRTIGGSLGEAIIPKAVRQIAAPFLLLILLLYYFVNGPLIFAGLWDQPGFANAILFYLGLVFASFLFAAVPRKTPVAEHLFKPVTGSLLLQLGAFVVAAVIVNTLIALSALRLSQADFGALGGTIVIQLTLFQLAVAGAEELFFRGAMFRFGVVISSVAFAAFHAYVYSSSPAFILAVAFAAVAGGAFYFIYAATKDRYGAAVNTAAHFGYNTALLGIILLGPLFTAFFA